MIIDKHKMVMLYILLVWTFFGIIICTESAQDGQTFTEKVKNDQEEVVDSLEFLNLDYLLGKFNPETHPDFAKIPKEYADRSGLYLRKDVLKAYLSMYQAASKAGHSLVIKSATRNFDYQKKIWEGKWQKRKLDYPNPYIRAVNILQYSSMPGTSRHHWGTDIDLNSFQDSYFESGKGEALYEWLQEYASSYGFCQPYTSKNSGREGYEEEKWHWSYTPVANELTQYASKNHHDSLINGFLGSETADSLHIVEKYILGVECE